MEEKYVRYGIDWQNQVMKNPKMMIVQMLRRVAMERDELQAAQLHTHGDGFIVCDCYVPTEHDGSVCNVCGEKPTRA